MEPASGILIARRGSLRLRSRLRSHAMSQPWVSRPPIMNLIKYSSAQTTPQHPLTPKESTSQVLLMPPIRESVKHHRSHVCSSGRTGIRCNDMRCQISMPATAPPGPSQRPAAFFALHFTNPLVHQCEVLRQLALTPCYKILSKY